MRILGWNYWVMCHTSTVRALRAQIKKAKPDMAFLSKTKANECHMEFVKSFIKFDNKIVVEAKGNAGGLCITWKKGLDINGVEFDKNMIAVKVTDKCTDWLLIGFYGPPYQAKKRKA